MCQKPNYEGSRTVTRPHLLKGHSSQAVRNQKAHRDSKEQMGRRSRSNTRGFLRKCQPSACQGSPVRRLPRGQTGAHEGNAVCTVFRNVWRLKAMCLGSEEPIIPSHAWQNDVKALVDNTWQISPLCHMLSVRALVFDGTNHDASVVTEGLDCLVRDIAKTWWHWCHDSVFKTKTHVIHIRTDSFFMRCSDSKTCD